MSMVRFVMARLGWAVVTIALISGVTFFATNVVPSDPAKVALGKFATPEQVAAYRLQQGLDRPVAERYCEWVGHLAEGNGGTPGVANITDMKLVHTRLGRTHV